MSHIALLSPELEAGGAQRVMLLLARELGKRGHRVDVVLLRAKGPLLQEIPAGVRLVDLGGNESGLGKLGFGSASVWRLATWLRQERPQAMLSTISGANLAALLARRIARTPVRLVIRETAAVDGFTSRWRVWAMRQLYPLADAVVALNPTMIERLVREIGVPEPRVRHIPNPIDNTYLREQGEKVVAHPWIDDSRLKVVLAVGRLIPQKAYDILLQAFARLPPTASARLLIVGEGPERSTLQGLASKLGIADRVQLVGFDPNPWRWMARADLFVLCSRSEGMPNSVLEARALGLPIVLTEYDRSARLVGGENAALVPVDDPEPLAKAIAAGFTKARQPSSPVSVGPDPIAAYEMVLCGGPIRRATDRVNGSEISGELGG